MRSRPRYRFGRKFLQAGVVFAVVLSAASMASAADPNIDSHTVAYEVVSFRYVALSEGDDASGLCGANGATFASGTNSGSAATPGDCAVDFGAVRIGTWEVESGGLLKYATTLSGDLIEAELDADIAGGAVLGVFVDGDLTAGNPCVSDGAGTFAAPTESGAATYATDTDSPSVFVTPVPLSSNGASVITAIDNCGEPSATNGPATATIGYIFDAQSASGSPSEDDSYAAVRVVTYTLKAGLGG